MYKERERMRLVSKLMSERNNSDTPQVIGEDEEYKFIAVDGKHGGICFLKPKRESTESEKCAILTTLAKVALSIGEH